MLSSYVSAEIILNIHCLIFTRLSCFEGPWLGLDNLGVGTGIGLSLTFLKVLSLGPDSFDRGLDLGLGPVHFGNLVHFTILGLALFLALTTEP